MTTAMPDGWYRATVDDVATFLTGFPFSSSGFSSSGVRLIRGSNVKRSAIDWSPDIARYWPAAKHSLRAFELAADDIVIAMDGALVGRSYARISSDDLPAYLVQRVARLRGHGIDQGLLYAWIGSEAFVSYVDSVKTHTAIPHISPRDIRAFELTLPTMLGEQRGIARALTDAEGVVAVLERLIAKKEAVKQGMMQQLLTGKTRLPGFDGDWKVGTLGEVARVDPEALSSGTAPDEVLDYIALEDVSRGQLLGSSRIAFKDAPSRARRVVRKTDVLFGTVRPNLQSHTLYCGGLSRPIASTGFAVVRPIPDRANARFLFNFLMSRLAMAQIERIIAGSNYPAVSSTHVRALRLALPAAKEQAAIAGVLADCEREIAVLRTRLRKAKAIKQSMVQELLAGRSRLPVMEAAA